MRVAADVERHENSGREELRCDVEDVEACLGETRVLRPGRASVERGGVVVEHGDAVYAYDSLPVRRTREE